MKKTLSTYEAADFLFQDENAGWTRAGAFALVEYLEELEYELDEEIELDVVAIRCDFSEYDSLVAVFEEYGINTSDLPEDEEERNDEIREYIRDHGTLIEFDGGVIVSAF